MVGSGDLWNSLSRSAARLMLCLGASAFALTMVSAGVVAQEGQAQPKSTQAPKTAPAAAPAGNAAAKTAGNAGAPAGDPWIKLCVNNEQTNNKQVCLTRHEGLEPNTGMALVTVMVRQTEGEEKQQLMIMMHTFEGLVIPAGMQMKIDDNEPVKLQYVVCFPNACQVQTELTPQLLENLRKGKKMAVLAMNVQQKATGFPIPLDGFSKAYDGPPIDTKKYEESRRQMMEYFRKRQAELAAQAQAEQQNKTANQAGAAPAAAPAAAPTAKNATTAQPKKPAAQ
jgi:invasion protein IalB